MEWRYSVITLSQYQLSAFLLACAAGLHAATPSPNGRVDFNRQVRPILSDKCFLCHGPDTGTRMVDLRLDIQEGALAKRKNGYPVVPGKPEESLLIKRIYSDNPAFRMPPVFSHKTLSDDQKGIFKRWIEQGGKWNQHWAFVAPKKVAPPPVKNPSWPRNDIDSFVLATMEANGFEPAAEADRRRLIRRVTLDITGLPPTPAEIEAFLKDKAADAYEKVVDRLLASPHYGEQRAHYWLDAARYADTNGLHFDNYREMWTYRDWVIKAFNKNMPFDQFTVDQLAGDLLPHPTLDQKIASGFQRNTVTTDEGGVILPEVEAMYAKDRADTTGTVFMGLTVGCATCHDHKFDPISQKDFYSLTSFFRNTTQPTMDLNVEDTPPSMYVPPDADRAEWERLTARRANVTEKMAARRHEQLQNIAEWLKTAQDAAHAYRPASEIFALPESQMPENVELADSIDVGGKTLWVKPGVTANVTGGPGLESDRPFTMAAWIHVPKLTHDTTVASQLERLPDGPDGKKRQRGWSLRITRGNLGLYDPAPAIYLTDADDKTISARPSPEYKFKPDSWYHVVITYDGSQVGRGLSMYVNGAPVFVLGRPEDSAHIKASMHASGPVRLGDSDKDAAPVGIADLRILGTIADAQDAALFRVASRVMTAATKTKQDLSQDDADALATFYTQTLDPVSAPMVGDLRAIDMSLYRIRRRSATALVMQERADSQPVAHVLYRGQYDQMRDEVHPNTPTVLPPMTQSMPRNRLGLAMWIVDPSNPLTARVTVNRFWQEIFGTGLVRTVEDFGSQGEAPSHPELLDWLAVDFRDSHWDVKRLFKRMVTSAAYRQSAETTPEKIAKDPQNRLLAHGPRFRMDAEMVRDYALFASGLLRPGVGGPSAKPYQPSRIWETVAMEQSNTRIYEQSQGEDLYRRSLYTFWKRAAPPPSMDIFNAPSRETCTVRRERTDTPLQALVTMNDVQFVEAARNLAQNAMKSDQRLNRELDFLSNRLLARPLDKQEAAVLTKSYNEFLAHYLSTPDDASKLLRVGASEADSKISIPKFAALTMVANTMLNLDETLVK